MMRVPLVVVLVVVVLVGLVMGKTEMKCNGWSTNSNCWEENCDSTDSTDEDCYACDHYQTEDQECRGKGGFEYADFTSCILPDTWTSLQNCSYSTTSGEQECSKVSNDLCKDSFTGFLIAGGRTCVAEGAYSLVNGTWEGDKGEEGCEAKGGVVLGKETCALEGSWGVVFNCYGVNSGVWSGNSVGLEEEGFVVGEECWGDLKDICKEEGGAYYNQYYLIDGKAHPTTNNALLSLPACAFPSPYYAYDLCGNSSKPGVGSCDEPCEGETFNQGWGCLLEGNWGVLSEGVEEGVCLASNGTFTRGGMCLLEGRDVVMSGDVERLSAGCLEKGGVLGEGGKACALEGIYSELYCPGFVEGVGGECEFPEGVCEGEEGFLVDEGCIVQGEWTLLNSVAPNGDSQGVECGWPQCDLIDGIIFDNCRMCAAPIRCRNYNPAVWKSIFITVILVAVLTLLLNFMTKIGIFFHQMCCKREVEYVE